MEIEFDLIKKMKSAKETGMRITVAVEVALGSLGV